MFDIQWFTVEREKFAQFSLVLLWQIQAVISLTTQFVLEIQHQVKLYASVKKLEKNWSKNNSVYSIHLK